MAIESGLPEIAELRTNVETAAGFKPMVHNDFTNLSDMIQKSLREHISETTLERLWNYSTRRYRTVSLRTLNVLARFAGYEGWAAFCQFLNAEGGCESEIFDYESVFSEDLCEGDRVRIGWQPNRLCHLKYLGDNRYEAIQCINSKMREGDRFTCVQFQLGSPLYLDQYCKSVADSKDRQPVRYGIGLKNGLTILQVIHDNSDDDV